LSSRFCVVPYSFERNEVDVPEELKRKLEHGMHHVTIAATQTDVLVKRAQERRSSIEEDETVKLIKEMYIKLKSKPPNFALCVKNGSYKITNYYEDAKDSKKDGQDGPRRAKQKILTVKTESPIYKLRTVLCKCLKGEMKRRKEVVSIMHDVNLFFEPGKMYLVL